MAFRVSEKRVELSLLHEIEVAGGEVKTSPHLYSKLAKDFGLSDAEQTAKYPSGGNKWKIRVGWARRVLRGKGELDSSTSSRILRITERGKKRLKQEWGQPPILGVKSAEEATEIAVNFVKKYRWLVRPLKAVREDSTWLVEIDVGPIFVVVAKVKVDAKSGDILEYNIPS